MRILIIVPEQDRVSGNWVTATRFKQGLEGHGCKILLHGAQLQDNQLIRERTSEFNPEVVLLLHAYRSGRPWLNNEVRDIPYVVMLTGTDLNQGLHDSEQNRVIQTVLQAAQAIVIQNPLQAEEFKKTHPALSAKIRKPAPGISLGEASYNIFHQHKLNPGRPLFLCPAGLRPVKGLLELLEMFDRIVPEHPELQLAFCGPSLDQNYSDRLTAAIKERSWAYYLGPVPPQAMADAMRGADVILNNSQAEGLSNTLLEAAALGIPILATNIPGNAAVVEHERNGLLYSKVDEFIACVSRLMSKAERDRLSQPSVNRYNPEQEAKELYRILHEATSSMLGQELKLQ